MSQTSVRVNDVPNSAEGHVDEVVVAGTLDAGSVQKGIDIVVQLGTVVANISNNETVKKIVSTFAGLATQSWFVSLIVGASSLFDKKADSQATQQFIASSLPPEVTDLENRPVIAGAVSASDVTASMDALLQVVTVVGNFTGNASLQKAVATLAPIVKEAWFINIVVNTAHFFGR